jgi:hypothetical protein
MFLRVFAIMVALVRVASAQSFDIPSHRWGLSFGNSKDFTGLRFNFRDYRVESVRGFNFTMWRPYDDDVRSRITGLSLGTIASGGTVRGLQLGILGVEAHQELSGISLAVLGAGSGGNINGIAIAGLGIGAGGDLWGLTVGGIGVGAGGDARGITIGGLGAGAGGNMTGLNIAGLGLGAGRNLSGINVAGLAMGAGERVAGINIAGLAVGGPRVRGFSAAGGAVGGLDLMGVQLAVGSVYVPRGGTMTGFSASAVNWIRGTQRGVAIGIVNYAERVRGLQLGVVNIIRENPVYARVLPVLNAGF